jgi:cysteine-rich repeat protein
MPRKPLSCRFLTSLPTLSPICLLTFALVFGGMGQATAQPVLVAKIPEVLVEPICLNSPALDAASSFGFRLGYFDPSLFFIGGEVSFPVGEAGSFDFNASNAPQFSAVVDHLTKGINEQLQTLGDIFDGSGTLLPGGAGNGGQESSRINGGAPDLIGIEIDFIRLIVTRTFIGPHVCAFPSQFGYSIEWEVTWQIWGIPRFCGNQIVDPGEQCDDGNVTSGDGCSLVCQLEPPLPNDRLRCQLTVGSAGKNFLQRLLTVGQECIKRQLIGTLPLEIDCRAASTGDKRTDAALTKAEDELERDLRKACEGVVLEGLGFPGQCADPDGPPFTLVELQQCLRETHTEKSTELLGLEFPLP